MSLRILIVEDEPVVAMHLEAIVTDAGHTVVGIAATMAAALKLAEHNRPIGLAIMDIDLLSRPDGIETARRLRNDHAISSLFVTAHLTEANVTRAQDVQPIGFIGKPFIDEQIVAAIEPFVGSREVQHGGSETAEAARLAGFDAGSDPARSAGACPWAQSGNRRDLRWAWLLGFAEGRASTDRQKRRL